MKRLLICLPALALAVTLAGLTCHDIQYTTDPGGDSPWLGQTVTVTGIVVEPSLYNGDGVYQWGCVIADSTGGPWSGLYFNHNQMLPSVGTVLQATGIVAENDGRTELAQVGELQIIAYGHPLPPPAEIECANLSGAAAEQWESVFVKLISPAVSALPDGENVFAISDPSGACYVDDQCFQSGFVWPVFANGENLGWIQGVAFWLDGRMAVNPRQIEDLEQYNCSLAVSGVITEFYQDQNDAFDIAITLRNYSDETIDDYELLLYVDDQLLSSAAGGTLAPQATLNGSLTALVDSCGYKLLRVALRQPTDAGLRQAYNWTWCIVRPDPANGVVFGAGDELSRLPWDFYWRFSLYEAMYYPDEAGGPGEIYGISFFNDFVTSNINTPVKVWIGETGLNNLSEDWIPATELDLVWDAMIYFPQLQNEVYVPFNQAYHYTGQNLVIMAYQSNNWYTSGNDKFLAQTLGEARARKRVSDAYDPDPYNPPAGIDPSGQVPKIAFYKSPYTATNDPVAQPAAFTGYPNPFKGNITFDLGEKDTPARIDIYNLKGQRVRTITGRGQLYWDGCGETGWRLPSGIYLARLGSLGANSIRRVCLID